EQSTTAVLTYVAPAKRAAVTAGLESALLDATREAAAGSDAQLQLLTAWASFARSPESLELLHGLLSGEQALDGLAVDQDIRWTLLTALATAGAADETEIDAELERDDTAT